MYQDERNRDYILITPAYNEEVYLEKTIHSVIAQAHLPKKWVIVSDGSTDRTDAIATNYAVKYRFIEFIRHEAWRFRTKPATDSVPNRPPIPIQIGH